MVVNTPVQEKVSGRIMERGKGSVLDRNGCSNGGWEDGDADVGEGGNQEAFVLPAADERQLLNSSLSQPSLFIFIQIV